jgi:hypothetical protein
MQPADADNTVRFQLFQSAVHQFDVADMDSVSARARDPLDMAVEQQGRAGVLNRRRKRLDAVDLAALVAIREAHQHRGDVGGRKQARERARKRGRICDLGGREIQPRYGRGRGRLFRRHAARVIATTRSGQSWNRLRHALPPRKPPSSKATSAYIDGTA